MELVQQRSPVKGEAVFASPPQGGITHSQQPQAMAVQDGVATPSHQSQPLAMAIDVPVAESQHPQAVQMQHDRVVAQSQQLPPVPTQHDGMVAQPQPPNVAPGQVEAIHTQQIHPQSQVVQAGVIPQFGVTHSQQSSVGLAAQGGVAQIQHPQVATQPGFSNCQPHSVAHPGVCNSQSRAPAPQPGVSNSQPLASGYIKYPPALAKYDEVAADPRLFMQTLEKLHTTMGTKFMIPIVGGKDLNLHRLFVEVTARGGIDNVIRDRKWKEITAVFSFPPTATNASFVLRKYYLSLLSHYEQIYYFRSEGWNPTTPDPVTPSHHSAQTPNSAEPIVSPQETNSSAPKRRRTANDFVSGAANLPPPPNCPVVGIIDGKFEHGYLVTVRAGERVLQGILYQTDDNSGFQAPKINYTNSKVIPGRRRKRRKKLSTLDPTHPKPNRSGYNFFFQEQHARLKPLHPGKDREISKMIGDLWNKLTETEKAVYLEIGLKDKERYQSEMVVYRERQRTGGPVCSLTPIQQQQQQPTVNKKETEIAEIAEKVMQQEEEESLSSEHSESSTESESDNEEASPEAETGTESGSLADEVPTESGDDFELRRRDQSGLLSGYKNTDTTDSTKALNTAGQS